MNNTYKKVLIVDDCSVVRARLSKELSGLGYAVTTANDGLEALAEIESQPYDYVLTDWEMPNLDGEQLCRYIRGADLQHYIYVVMMTAHTNAVDVVAGMNAGADDFVTKPIDYRELIARMMNGARILNMERSLSDDANCDPLTGLLNRRTFTQATSAAIDSCRRYDHPLSCVMIDLDFFKQINDTNGHIVGDSALMSVADILRRSFRQQDLVFRYGGEEFAVILHGADEEAAKCCAERCRKEIEAVKHVNGIDLTISCGVAQADMSNPTVVDVIDRADTSLLTAKRKGRNQTVCFSQCEPELAATTTES